MNRPSEEMLMYIGSYAEASSEGIVCAAFDPATGRMRRVAGTSGIKDPSYLAIDRNKRRLYAVSEQENSILAVYAVDEQTGELQWLQEQPTNGGSACYVELDQDRRVALVANYSGSNAVAFGLDDEGGIITMMAELKHEGSGPRQDRQEGPHPHSFVAAPDGRFAVVPDLGTDQVVIYRLDTASGRLSPHASAKVTPGAGPRHFAFHPTKPYAYVINELDSTITAFLYEAAEGRLTVVQTLSTLPEDWTGTSYCAHIQISADGLYLYGSNRGHDSLAVFRIEEDGSLTSVQLIATGGRTPRNFALTPDGGYLLAANQDSDEITCFLVDQENGCLQRVEASLKTPKPVCIQFL